MQIISVVLNYHIQNVEKFFEQKNFEQHGSINIGSWYMLYKLIATQFIKHF